MAFFARRVWLGLLVESTVNNAVFAYMIEGSKFLDMKIGALVLLILAGLFTMFSKYDANLVWKPPGGGDAVAHRKSQAGAYRPPAFAVWLLNVSHP